MINDQCCLTSKNFCIKGDKLLWIGFLGKKKLENLARDQNEKKEKKRERKRKYQN